MNEDHELRMNWRKKMSKICITHHGCNIEESYPLVTLRIPMMHMHYLERCFLLFGCNRFVLSHSMHGIWRKMCLSVGWFNLSNYNRNLNPPPGNIYYKAWMCAARFKIFNLITLFELIILPKKTNIFKTGSYIKEQYIINLFSAIIHLKTCRSSLQTSMSENVQWYCGGNIEKYKVLHKYCWCCERGYSEHSYANCNHELHPI